MTSKEFVKKYKGTKFKYNTITWKVGNLEYSYYDGCYIQCSTDHYYKWSSGLEYCPFNVNVLLSLPEFKQTKVQVDFSLNSLEEVEEFVLSNPKYFR